jgi:hypothetical protein
MGVEVGAKLKLQIWRSTILSLGMPLLGCEGFVETDHSDS